MFWRAFFWVPWVLVVPSAVLAEDISHVVRPGDTPVALSKIYHVPVAAILARNKGLDPCRIKIGQVLFVPAASGIPVTSEAPVAATPAQGGAVLPDEESPDLRYSVVSGDNPAGIAERFGISLDVLSRANPGIDPKNLAIGRVLSIPKGQACPPAPVPVARPDDSASGAPLVMDFQ
jgi:LysM repeat protein